jgi:hypothetical protein
MARTRACKARSRPPSRNVISRGTPNRGSTVESLRISITSTEEGKNNEEETPSRQANQQAPNIGRCLRDVIDEEEHNVSIKQEDDAIEETNETTISLKRRAHEPTLKTSVAKKRKPSPPAFGTRITRSKTLPYRNERAGVSSDSDSESDADIRVDTKPPLIKSSLHLLRPYLAFQLLVSGLTGKAYKAAQASMESVLDVAEGLEKDRGVALTRAHDSLSSSNEESEECAPQSSRKQGKEEKMVKADKLGTSKEEDALPRKQRELNEQTRKRLEQENRRREKQYQRAERDSVSRRLNLQPHHFPLNTNIHSPPIPLTSLLLRLKPQRK